MSVTAISSSIVTRPGTAYCQTSTAMISTRECFHSLQSLPTATNNTIFYTGWAQSNSLSSGGTDCIRFVCDYGRFGNANWWAEVRTASTSTTVDTGVTPHNASTMSGGNRMKFVVNNRTNVVFTIDGTVVATITTNIPTTTLMYDNIATFSGSAYTGSIAFRTGYSYLSVDLSDTKNVYFTT